MPWRYGSVTDEGDGNYRVWISLGNDAAGKRRRASRRVKAENRTALMAELERLRREYGLDMARSKDASPQTLGAYLESWLARKDEQLSPKTMRSYRASAKLIAPIIGHVRVDQIASSHVTLLLQRLRANGKGARTVQASYDALRAALHFALRADRIIASHPMAAVPRPTHHHEIAYYTAEEAWRFLDAVAEDRFRALFHLVVATGLRAGEVFGLQWSDIDLDRAHLSVRRALSETRKLRAPKTQRSRRLIRLPTSVVAELRAHRERLIAEGLKNCEIVFPSTHGTSMHMSNFERRHFFPAMARAGLHRIRFHDLRHTAATIRLSTGDSPKVVQEMLGHSSIRTTMDVYGHIAPSMQDESAARYDALREAAKAGAVSVPISSKSAHHAQFAHFEKGDDGQSENPVE